MKIFNYLHLQQVEESYWEHFKFSIWAAMVLGLLSIVSIIHGVFPFLFPRIPDKIYRYFVNASSERMKRVNSLLKKKKLE